MIVLFGEVGGDIAEAGGEDNDAYLVVGEGGIGGQTVFEIDIGVDVLHELVDVIHFIDLQRVNRIFGTEDGEAKRLGILDVAIVEEGRFECGIDGFAQTVLAGGHPGGHDGHSTFAQAGVDIAEVEIYTAASAHIDDFDDGTHGVGEGVVGLFEGIFHREVAIDVEKTLVVDDEQGVHLLTDALNAVECFVDLQLLLEKEGDGDNADGENTLGHGLSCNDRGGTGSGTPTHTCGDEHHVEVVFEGFANGFDIFLCQGATAFGASAGAETGAELYVIGDGGVCKGFGVGVADEEANAFDILAIHVANGVSAAATDTDDFDDGYGGFGFLGGSDFHKGLEVFLFVGMRGVIRHVGEVVPNRRWMIGEGG